MDYLPMSSPSRVCCQKITVSDLAEVVSLLTENLPRGQDRTLGTHALQVLSVYCSPPGYPNHRYLPDNDGIPAGVIESNDEV